MFCSGDAQEILELKYLEGPVHHTWRPRDGPFKFFQSVKLLALKNKQPPPPEFTKYQVWVYLFIYFAGEQMRPF